PATIAAAVQGAKLPFGTLRRSWPLPFETQFKLACSLHRLDAIGDVQFLEKCRQIKLDRLHVQTKLLRDLLVSQSLREMIEDLPFSDAQGEVHRRTLQHDPFHQHAGSELGRDIGLAGVDGLYGRDQLRAAYAFEDITAYAHAQGSRNGQ